MLFISKNEKRMMVLKSPIKAGAGALVEQHSMIFKKFKKTTSRPEVIESIDLFICGTNRAAEGIHKNAFH